jgi:hypothetical protein
MLQELKRFRGLFRAIFAGEKKYLAFPQVMQRLLTIRIGAMTHHDRRTPSM